MFPHGSIACMCRNNHKYLQEYLNIPYSDFGGIKINILFMSIFSKNVKQLQNSWSKAFDKVIINFSELSEYQIS